MRVPRPRAAARRATRSRTSGTCSRRSASARPIRARNPVEMALDPAATQRVDDAPSRCGSANDRAVVVMHVSAGNPFRRWPVDRFAELAAARRDPTDAADVVHDVGSVGSGAADAASRLGARRLARDCGRGSSMRRVRSRGTACAWSTAPRCTSAATAARCTSRRRRGMPIVGLTDRRSRSVGPVARPGNSARSRRSTPVPALPSVRPAIVRAWRLPLPDRDYRGPESSPPASRALSAALR